MQAPRFTGVVRVTNSREEIEQATQVGLEKKREGYSPEALVLAVDEIVHNLPLARAIVLYVQSAFEHETDASVERPFSWFSVLVSVGFAASCLWLIFALLQAVGPATSIWVALLIVIGQSILFRFAQRGMRLAFMSAIDGLNDASYPTNLHPLRNASSAVGTLRLRRLRALVMETSERIIAGERPDDLVADLAVVNLTPRAARFIVRLAVMAATLRDYLPPYQSPWLGYTLGLAFWITGLIVIDRTGSRLAEGYKNYALAVATWIAWDLAARPRRPRRAPPEMP
ncbi:MAG: hypothetical protein ACHQ50_17990 [Fimbriimonadales bacterium]